MRRERGGVGDREPARREVPVLDLRQEPGGAVADDGRVLPRSRSRPGEPKAGMGAQGLEPRRREPRGLARARGQGRGRDLLVERQASVEAAVELAAVAAERPLVVARDPLPGDLALDVAPDDDVARERLADARRLDRAAAERDDAAAGKQLADRALLALAETGLALDREDVHDRPAVLLLDRQVRVASLGAEGLGEARAPRRSCRLP